MNTATRTSLRILAALGLGVTIAPATPIYVDAAAKSSIPDGLSWSTAFQLLDDALDAASASALVTEIRVARGTYVPTDPNGFALVTDVDLLGGFDGSTSSTPDARRGKTVLSGETGDPADPSDNALHVLIADGTGNTALVEGFTILHGYADGTGPNEDLGGGIFIDQAAVTIRDCHFVDNYALGFGGGAAVEDDAGGTRFENCGFYANRGAEFGGGIYNDANQGTVVLSCRFTGNLSGRGGGVHNDAEGMISVLNSGFSGNEVEYDGGGIYLSTGSYTAQINNCSILRNIADGAGCGSGLGGGIAGGNSSTTIYNCVVWNNTGSAGALLDQVELAFSLDLQHCCLNNWPSWGFLAWRDCLATPPLLVNLRGSDAVVGTPDDVFRIRSTSPLIDAGDDALVHPDIVTEGVDLGGGPRFNGTVDIGAAER